MWGAVQLSSRVEENIIYLANRLRRDPSDRSLPVSGPDVGGNLHRVWEQLGLH